MKKRFWTSAAFWMAGVTTLVYLPGSIHRALVMPPTAAEPLPAAPTKIIAANGAWILPGIGSAKIEAIARATTPGSYVTYSPEGAQFTATPLWDYELATWQPEKRVVAAEIKGDRSRIFIDDLLLLKEDREKQGYPSPFVGEGTLIFMGNARPDMHPTLSYKSAPKKPWGVRLGVALKDEVRTIAETPVWNPLLERFGEPLNFTVTDASFGSTEHRGAELHLRLPPKLNAQLHARTVAIRVQGINYWGQTREFFVTNRDATSLTGIVSGETVSSLRSIRIIAAPIHWAEFRDLPTGPKGLREIEPDYFPITREVLEFVDGSRRDEKGFVELARTSVFASAEEAVPVRDAVVVVKGGVGVRQAALTLAPSLNLPALFTTHVPADVVGYRQVVAVLTDKTGRTYESPIYRVAREQDRETDTLALEWSFPNVRAQDVRTFALQIRR